MHCFYNLFKETMQRNKGVENHTFHYYEVGFKTLRGTLTELPMKTLLKNHEIPKLYPDQSHEEQTRVSQMVTAH